MNIKLSIHAISNDYSGSRSNLTTFTSMIENKSLLGTNSLAGLSFNYSVYDMKWIDSHDALCETFVFVLCGQKGLCQQKLPCTMWTVT